jgi:hypothetical protein
MLRVARKSVFLSDANRFGQGRISLRVLKLLLSKAGLWPLANLIKAQGKVYSYSQGDGMQKGAAGRNATARLRKPKLNRASAPATKPKQKVSPLGVEIRGPRQRCPRQQQQNRTSYAIYATVMKKPEKSTPPIQRQP